MLKVDPNAALILIDVQQAFNDGTRSSATFWQPVLGNRLRSAEQAYDAAFSHLHGELGTVVSTSGCWALLAARPPGRALRHLSLMRRSHDV